MIPRKKLYQRISDSIAAEIGAGTYPAGTRLPAERDLAERFKVSRPTIREAMIALEIRGLVDARKGSGIYVSSAPREAVAVPRELDVGAFELIEARTLFEGESAALAATTINDAQLTELRGLLAEMRKARNPEIALDVDRRFHIAIAMATGNSLVVSAVEKLWSVRAQSPLCAHMFARAQRMGVMPRVEEHELIVEALARKDSQRARETMRAHLRRVTEDLLEATKLELMEKAEADFAEQRRRLEARNPA